MSASRIEIPNVREPAVFDQGLYQWVRKKCNDAAPVFTAMVAVLQRRMGDSLHGLVRVEFYGAVDTEGAVYVKCIPEGREPWQEKWLFDFDGKDVAFFPYPSR